MKRFAFLLFAGVVAVGSCVGFTDGRETQIAAARELSSPEPVSIEFTAKASGSFSVILDFSWPIADASVLKVVDDAAATTGSDQAPAFDFTWQLLRQARVISERTSPQRSTGTVDVGTSGLGGGPLKSRGLVFGDFGVKAGEVYTLRVLPGPGFGFIARAKPRVVVQRLNMIKIDRAVE